METIRGDNQIAPAPELLQTEGPIRGDRRNTGRKDWFTNWVKEREDTGKNVLGVLTGELGIGKSYMGLQLCYYFDPEFSVDRVVFMGSDFMKAVEKAPKGSWVLFDEPNLGIGHRTFMNIVNRTVAGFVQASRFLMVNALFALPSADLMDTAVVRVAHIRIRVTGRGWGKVERIKHSEYEGGPRIRFKGMGSIKVGMPPARLCHEYEAKRKEFHNSYFKSQELAQAEKRAIISEKKIDPRVQEIVERAKEFMADPESGKFSPTLIARAFGISNGQALAFKAEYSYKKKQQTIIQS